MITAQDIREKTFEKSRLNGYDMAAVDDFLEELAEEITNSQRENAVLKQKMKVLVDKIEEYRSNEEALNLAILSAQKLAVQIENEARQRANVMLAEADAQVKAKVGSIVEETELQQRRLADAKAATAKYFEAARALCNAQLHNLDAINGEIDTQTEAPAPKAADVDDAVRSIEETAVQLSADPDYDVSLTVDDEGATAELIDFESTQPFTV